MAGSEEAMACDECVNPLLCRYNAGSLAEQVSTAMLQTPCQGMPLRLTGYSNTSMRPAPKLLEVPTGCSTPLLPRLPVSSKWTLAQVPLPHMREVWNTTR